ncbi:MAG: hypothetical protein JRJ64_05025 [Deltaproteobacteria bacterium]|nr:hypothetical protein [Deltaproteobacteria bacterium]
MSDDLGNVVNGTAPTVDGSATGDTNDTDWVVNNVKSNNGHGNNEDGGNGNGNGNGNGKKK